MDTPKLSKILKVMKAKGYKVFKDPRGLDLNIVGIRTNDNRSNKFNDWLTVFYIEDGMWFYSAFPATTDPGLYWRHNLMQIKGTAIVKPGQYRGSHQVGLHRGYTALIQTGKTPITIYRDANRDGVLDVTGVEETTGYYGINIHRANATVESENVDKWSAGCQVFANPDHFDFFMRLCKGAKKKYGNFFTYTLLTESDFE